MLSDGADTGDTAIADVTAAITEAGLLVDVVALEQSGAALDALGELARAGNGRVISADSNALAETFSAEADVLATQVLVTAQVPATENGAQGTIKVSAAHVDGRDHRLGVHDHPRRHHPRGTSQPTAAGRRRTG